jgi:crotonobetainyl-CoA:carnitine CoA-transferase CaiB-like acyl-CoA transferase
VLDLTRVIAGPVATRTLALLGADVLRIDPPHLPEPEWQHLDSGHGKRSTLLDLTRAGDRAAFDHLLETADVVVTGYRARALERLGLGPQDLTARHPGIVVARLTAWGSTGATGDRRGFDSLVQAASGVAWIESPDGNRPGALPAQALDHSAGYLLAAGVVMALGRQASEGGSWSVEVSLRRVAAELLGLPRTDEPEPNEPAFDPAPHLQSFEVDGLVLTTTAPALAYDGGPTAFDPPRRWARDSPTWIER